MRVCASCAIRATRGLGRDGAYRIRCGAGIDGRSRIVRHGLSFVLRAKNLTTAEGGMITTNDETIAQKLQMIRQHGMRQRYLHEALGFNFRMTDIQAAIGVAQLAKLEALTAKRIANANFFSKELSAAARVPVVPPGYRHVFHQYTIRVRGDRDQVVEQLKAHGIGTGIYYPIPIHKQPFYLQMGYQDTLPVSELLAQQVISLPVHPGLSQSDLERIVQEVRALCSM
jgi:perosamine synthetase